MNQISATPELVNLTPHDINLLLQNGEQVVLPSARKAARLQFSTKVRTMLQLAGPSGQGCGFPIEDVTIGETLDLPEPEEGKLFVVSQIVVTQHPERDDLVAPKKIERKDGVTIGCRSFGR